MKTEEFDLPKVSKARLFWVVPTRIITVAPFTILAGVLYGLGSLFKGVGEFCDEIGYSVRMVGKSIANTLTLPQVDRLEALVKQLDERRREEVLRELRQ